MSSTDQMKNINKHMEAFITTHGGNDMSEFYEEHAESEVETIVEELTKMLKVAWKESSNQKEFAKNLVVKGSAKAKKPKDPDAPKRGKSAYIFFSSAKRAEAKEAVAEEKGDEAKTSDVTAKLGEMWQELKTRAVSDAKAGKELKKYEKMAADDKERYEAEKAEYTPLTEEELTEKLSSKKRKDPNAPKRGKSAYMYFCAEYRSVVKEDLGDEAASKDVTTELGKRWTEMKTDKKKAKELKKFEKMAADDKERYEKEKAEYVPSEGDDDDEKPKPKKASKVPKKDAVKSSPKKSPSKETSSKKSVSSSKKVSAYTCFVKARRPEMKEEDPDMSGAEITKQLAKAWKEMDDEGKESWKQRAEEEAEVEG